MTRQRATVLCAVLIFRFRAAIQILDQHHLIMTLVIDHLVNQLTRDEDAKAAGADAFILAHLFMLRRVACRVEKSRDGPFGTIERLDAEALAGVFDAIEDNAWRAQVADLNILGGIVLAAMLYGVAQHFAEGV